MGKKYKKYIGICLSRYSGLEFDLDGHDVNGFRLSTVPPPATGVMRGSKERVRIDIPRPKRPSKVKSYVATATTSRSSRMRASFLEMRSDPFQLRTVLISFPTA